MKPSIGTPISDSFAGDACSILARFEYFNVGDDIEEERATVESTLSGDGGGIDICAGGGANEYFGFGFGLTEVGRVGVESAVFDGGGGIDVVAGSGGSNDEEALEVWPPLGAAATGLRGSACLTGATGEVASSESMTYIADLTFFLGGAALDILPLSRVVAPRAAPPLPRPLPRGALGGFVAP